MSDGITDAERYNNKYREDLRKKYGLENMSYEEEKEYWKNEEQKRLRRKTKGERLEQLIRHIGYEFSPEYGKGNKIYLAYPYTPNPQEGFDITTAMTIALIKQGFEIFSPITYTHLLAEAKPEGGWYTFDLPYLKMCNCLLTVLPQYYSAGVAMEVGYMIGHERTIYYMEEKDAEKLVSGIKIPKVEL